MTKQTKTTSTIQERMENKAFLALGEVEHQIDRLLEQKKSSFSMYKYIKRLDYSGRVVNYMKGFANDVLYELKNEEKCDQLEEAYNFLTPKQKERVIKKLETWEQEVEQYCEEYKPVRKVRIKTPAQLVKKLPYLEEWKQFKSINPEEIIRARLLYTYNTSSKKLTKFEGLDFYVSHMACRLENRVPQGSAGQKCIFAQGCGLKMYRFIIVHVKQFVFFLHCFEFFPTIQVRVVRSFV